MRLGDGEIGERTCFIRRKKKKDRAKIQRQASLVPSVSRTKRETANLKPHLSSSHHPLQTLKWALLWRERLARLLDQQQRPLPWRRLSRPRTWAWSPLWGKKGSGCLVSMSSLRRRADSTGLTTSKNDRREYLEKSLSWEASVIPRSGVFTL